MSDWVKYRAEYWHLNWDLFLNYFSTDVRLSANFVIRLNSSQLGESNHQTQSGVISRELPAAAPRVPVPATMIMIITWIGTGSKVFKVVWAFREGQK